MKNINKISDITRQDIFDVLTMGIVDETMDYQHNIVDLSRADNNNIIKINYYGRLEETTFLSRLYDLERLQSTDHRFKNAADDIRQHRINNNDWDDNWIFFDPRFDLMDCSDEKLLAFLCEIFHPIVREEAKPWRKIHKIINDLLKKDGYELYEKDHISGRTIYGWKKTDQVSIELKREIEAKTADLKLIGEGSYAHVFKFHDDFYNQYFVVKRAKKDLIDKEIKRFYREYEELSKLDSPYIVKVYRCNYDNNSYIMEYMDTTLNKFIDSNNRELTFQDRKYICYQFLMGYKYIHSKSLLHRDISHKNVLIKKYDDGTIVVKISDFGLVKIPESELTSENTEYKGYFNDPKLRLEGFDSYSILHEIYAITCLIFYVMSGKTNTDKISNHKLREFVNKGMNPDKNNRFKDIDELYEEFKNI